MSPRACGAMLLICETRKVDLKGAYVSQNPNSLATIAPWDMVCPRFFRTARGIQFSRITAIPQYVTLDTCHCEPA